MSSWRTYECRLENVNHDYMGKALDRMGFTLDTNRKTLSKSYHYNNNVDGVLIRNDGEELLDLGIIWNDKHGKTTIVGDFFDTGFDSMRFMNQLTMEYNMQLQMAAAEAAGYTIDETTLEVNADGELEVQAYMYA